MTPLILYINGGYCVTQAVTCSGRNWNLGRSLGGQHCMFCRKSQTEYCKVYWDKWKKKKTFVPCKWLCATTSAVDPTYSDWALRAAMIGREEIAGLWILLRRLPPLLVHSCSQIHTLDHVIWSPNPGFTHFTTNTLWYHSCFFWEIPRTFIRKRKGHLREGLKYLQKKNISMDCCRAYVLKGIAKMDGNDKTGNAVETLILQFGKQFSRIFRFFFQNEVSKVWFCRFPDDLCIVEFLFMQKETTTKGATFTQSFPGCVGRSRWSGYSRGHGIARSELDETCHSDPGCPNLASIFVWSLCAQRHAKIGHK